MTWRNILSDALLAGIVGALIAAGAGLLVVILGLLLRTW
jgi:hypothetical protein